MQYPVGDNFQTGITEGISGLFRISTTNSRILCDCRFISSGFVGRLVILLRFYAVFRLFGPGYYIRAFERSWGVLFRVGDLFQLL